MLKKISFFFGIITCLSAFVLIYSGASFGPGVEYKVFFNIIVFIFDLSLFISLILLIVYSLKKNKILSAILFSFILLIFIANMIVLKIFKIHSQPLLYLFDVIIIFIFSIYFYLTKGKN
jgi:hypothetical protein